MDLMDLEATERPKRMRQTEPTVDDVLYEGRLVMGRNPFKESAPKTEDDNFRALFGCSAGSALHLWNLIVHEDALPSGGTLRHMIWTLFFVKVYPTDRTCKIMLGADDKTIRKWVYVFMQAISSLEGIVVSLRFSESLFDRVVAHHIALLLLLLLLLAD